MFLARKERALVRTHPLICNALMIFECFYDFFSHCSIFIRKFFADIYLAISDSFLIHIFPNQYRSKNHKPNSTNNSSNLFRCNFSVKLFFLILPSNITPFIIASVIHAKYFVYQSMFPSVLVSMVSSSKPT